jgi:hypothetical protein
VKSEVLSRKRILISDPAAQRMNSTQWNFELLGLVERDKRKYEDISSIMKVSRNSLIDMLGLNTIPVEESLVDEEGNTYTRLRKPDENEITPLAFLCGNDAVLSKVAESHAELQKQEELEEKEESGKIVMMTPEELDEFMQDDDLIFPDDPEELEKKLKWESFENKEILKHMVKPMNQKDDILNESNPSVVEGERRRSSTFRIK